MVYKTWLAACCNSRSLLAVDSRQMPSETCSSLVTAFLEGVKMQVKAAGCCLCSPMADTWVTTFSTTCHPRQG